MKGVPALSESAERIEMVEMIESLFEAIVDQQDELYIDAGSVFAHLPMGEPRVREPIESTPESHLASQHSD